MSQPSDLSDALRDACRTCGLSVLQIAKDLDINRSTLQRFIRGDGDLKLSVADQLADYLGVTAEFDGGLAIIRPLIRPKKLWSWRELRASRTHPPASPGVYAWWFREIPPGIPTWGTERYQRYRLLYVGISPSKPSVSTGKESKQTVRDRLRYQFSGNIGGSTLRVSLASLLRQELKLRPVWTSFNSLHLRKGEERLRMSSMLRHSGSIWNACARSSALSIQVCYRDVALVTFWRSSLLNTGRVSAWMHLGEVQFALLSMIGTRFLVQPCRRSMSNSLSIAHGPLKSTDHDAPKAFLVVVEASISSSISQML